MFMITITSNKGTFIPRFFRGFEEFASYPLGNIKDCSVMSLAGSNLQPHNSALHAVRRLRNIYQESWT